MKLFAISESSCGDAKTTFVKSSTLSHVKRYLLLNYHPNDYYCTEFNLDQNRENALLCAIVRSHASMKKDRWGMEAGYNHVDVENKDIGSLSKYLDWSFNDIIAEIPKSDIDALFQYAFTGGFGEQSGNPGKEWHTFTIQEFNESDIRVIEPLKKRNKKNKIV